MNLGLTKGELIKLLQENKQPMNMPVQITLEATNNDTSIVSLSVQSINYQNKAIHINGTYEEDEY